MVDFVMKRYRVDFKTAAQRLGAWRDQVPSERAPQMRLQGEEQARQRAAEELRRAERREHMLLLRDNLHVALRLQREVTDELEKLHRAAGDEEPCWEWLSLLADYVRQCDDQYCNSAGLECA
jgi:hypothetical protein